jgi:phosphatidylethanolamine/phosphatidyl-N-methylethanolamine N-methyltransferase
MPSNAWVRFRYTFWAPHYDRVTRFPRERRRSIALLELRPEERLVIIGCGTGADIPFVPAGVEVLATDLTPAMIRQARAHARPGVEFRVMNGLALDLPDGSFDAAILHMVL